jgi:hypothetical protein
VTNPPLPNGGQSIHCLLAYLKYSAAHLKQLRGGHGSDRNMGQTPEAEPSPLSSSQVLVTPPHPRGRGPKTSQSTKARYIGPEGAGHNSAGLYSCALLVKKQGRVSRPEGPFVRKEGGKKLPLFLYSGGPYGREISHKYI